MSNERGVCVGSGARMNCVLLNLVKDERGVCISRVYG